MVVCLWLLETAGVQRLHKLPQYAAVEAAIFSLKTKAYNAVGS